MNQALRAKLFGHGFACVQRLRNFPWRKGPDIASDWQIEEVGVWRNFAGGDSRNAGVIGKVDCVSDDRSGSVGLGGGFGEDGDRVGDPERKAAAAPAAGGDSPDTSCRGNLYGAKERGSFGTLDHTDFVALVLGEMHCDVTAVVYVAATKLRGVGHRDENGFSDRPGDSGHRSDETAMAIRQDSFKHPAGDGAGRLCDHRNIAAQQRQLSAELIEDRDESICGGFVGAADFERFGVGANNKIDGAVIQV